MKPGHFSQKNKNTEKDLGTFGFGMEMFLSYTARGGALHTHEQVEMVFVERGEGMHRLECGDRPAEPGSLAIIHHNQAHGFTTPPGGLDLINIYLDMRRFKLPLMPPELRTVLPQLLPLHPSFGHNLRNPVLINFARPDYAAGLLRAMKHELDRQQEGYADSLYHLLTLFFLEACRSFQTSKTRQDTLSNPWKKGNSSERIAQLCRHLDRNFTEPVHLHKLEKLTGFQKNYLCRVFKAKTGQTIMTYVLHLRLGQAMLLLRQTDKPVVEIALESGFSDLPHFNRTFRREVGKPPREYRREWRR